MSAERRAASRSGRTASARPDPRPYRRPELQVYGALKDLTGNFIPGRPGDLYSTSFRN